jgi:hypothetical protein
VIKPTVEELGIDPDAQQWQRSGDDAGAIEIAFAHVTPGVSVVSGVSVTAGDTGGHGTQDDGDGGGGGDWILMRIADDPARRVLVFDRNEWECFLDGARKGEFDDAASSRFTR